MKENFLLREVKGGHVCSCSVMLPWTQEERRLRPAPFWLFGFLVMSVDKLNPGGSVFIKLCPSSTDVYFCSHRSCSSVWCRPCSPLPPPPFGFLWVTLSFKHCCVMSLPFSLKLFSRPEGETSDTITDGCLRKSGINAAVLRSDRQRAPY